MKGIASSIWTYQDQPSVHLYADNLTYGANKAGAFADVWDKSKALCETCEDRITNSQIRFWSEDVLAVGNCKADNVSHNLASLAGFECRNVRRAVEHFLVDEFDVFDIIVLQSSAINSLLQFESDEYLHSRLCSRG